MHSDAHEWREKLASLPLIVPPGSADSDIVVATWAGGHSHEVPGLSIGRLKEILGRGHSTGDLWCETHCESKHKLTVKQRVDRCLLLSLYEQQQQILQLRLNLFGKVEDEAKQLPKEHPTLQKALSLLIPLATKYAKNEIKKQDLKTLRDSEMKNIVPSPCLKRPAASQAKEEDEVVTSGASDDDTPEPPKSKKRPSAAPKAEQAEAAAVECQSYSEYSPIGFPKGSFFSPLFTN